MGVKTIPARAIFTCDGAGCDFTVDNPDDQPHPDSIADVYVGVTANRVGPMGRYWLCRPCQSKLEGKIMAILATDIAVRIEG